MYKYRICLPVANDQSTSPGWLLNLTDVLKIYSFEASYVHK